jgi:hypothetical protein
MWRELINVAGKNREDGPVLHTAASDEDIRQAESLLGIEFPTDLVNLLKETNGVDTEYGEFLWSARKIAEENLAFRQNPDFARIYMPFDPLLFFGQELNGDLYAYRILQGEVQPETVYRWDHESDSRQFVAAHLPSFVERWFREELSG